MRYFDFSLSRIIKEHACCDRDLSLIVTDIDCFKQINNCIGYQVSEDVLRGIGRLFLNGLRQYDLPARYSGEDISVIVPEIPINPAIALAERISKEAYQHFIEKSYPLTVSIGVSCIQKPNLIIALQLIHSADKALYAAKDCDKNEMEKYT